MSKFIISLDYELRWGVFNVFDERYDDNLLGARQVIPQILNLFKEHRIKATWAIVGLLFNSTKEEFYKNKPLLEPSYNVDANNPYLEEIGDSEEFPDSVTSGLCSASTVRHFSVGLFNR